MIRALRVAVVMPAYRNARTVERVVREIDRAIVDDVIAVDDGSDDETRAACARAGVAPLVHAQNRGYGAAQKSGYAEALARGADIVVMVHADYQYTPRLVPAMASMIAEGIYDVVLGSRILGGGALRGGMPVERYIANRALTFLQNLVTGAKLSEYHTGLRAFSRRVLVALPLARNDDGFDFDAELLAQCLYAGFRVGELSCPTRYAPDSSSITLPAAACYAASVLRIAAEHGWARLGGAEGPTLRGVRGLSQAAPRTFEE